LIHVEPSINFGIINSIIELHLVGISTEFNICIRRQRYRTFYCANILEFIFLILSFRLVLNVISFLSGVSPAAGETPKRKRITLEFISLRFPEFGGKTKENHGKPKPGLSNPGKEFNSEIFRIKVSAES
jgi:hypothetical protein